MDILVRTGGFPPLRKCLKEEVNIRSTNTPKKRELTGVNIGINIHNILKARRIKKPFL